MIKVLIVEDDDKIRRIIKEYLNLENILYKEATDGEEAINIFNEDQFNAIILDIMMPKIDGWSVCKQIREKSDIPIIMLTARGEERDKLFGFDLEIDDYIIKPFSPKELIARLKAVIRRYEKSKNINNSNQLVFKDLKINTLSRDVSINDLICKLSPKEYDLLVYLLKNKNRVLTRQQILDGVWGIDFFGEDRTVDTHIKSLRERLKNYKKYIVTVWGVGYKFNADEKNE